MPRPAAAARSGEADDRRGASCPGTCASQRSSVPPPGGLERRSGVGPAAQISLVDHRSLWRKVTEREQDQLRLPTPRLAHVFTVSHMGVVTADLKVALISSMNTARRLLEIPYTERITPALLRLHPQWDPLRGDPRFQKLCEQKPQ
jgi:hypothetical protein